MESDTSEELGCWFLKKKKILKFLVTFLMKLSLLVNSDVNKTPGLKTKTPHTVANICATFMSNVQKFTLTIIDVTMTQYPNSGI